MEVKGIGLYGEEIYSILDIRHAFLAGLIEGDGSIYLRAHKDSRKQFGACFGMAVKVSNTKEELLQFLKENFGGRICSYQPKAKGRSRMYELSIESEKAKSLLLYIYPYLVIKKKQAELAVKFQTRLFMDARRGSTPCSRREYEEKVEMAKEMHELNAKSGDKQWLKL